MNSTNNKSIMNSTNNKSIMDSTKILASNLMHQIKDPFISIRTIFQESIGQFKDIFNALGSQQKKFLIQNLSLSPLQNARLYSIMNEKKNYRHYKALLNHKDNVKKDVALVLLNYSNLYNGNGHTLKESFKKLNSGLSQLNDIDLSGDQEALAIKVHILLAFSWQKAYHRYSLDENGFQFNVEGSNFIQRAIDLIDECNTDLKLLILERFCYQMDRYNYTINPPITQQWIKEQILKCLHEIQENGILQQKGIFRYYIDRLIIAVCSEMQEIPEEIGKVGHVLRNLLQERDNVLFTGGNNLQDIEKKINEQYALIDLFYQNTIELINRGESL